MGLACFRVQQSLAWEGEKKKKRPGLFQVEEKYFRETASILLRRVSFDKIWVVIAVLIIVWKAKQKADVTKRVRGDSF